MKARSIKRVLTRALAVVVCTLSLASSVYGLWHVCTNMAKMPALVALGVLAVFDGSALVFGLKVAESPKETAGWVGVIGTAVLSSAAQILAAPIDAEWWRLLHGAPALGAIWTLHSAVKEEGAGGKNPARRPPAAHNGTKAAPAKKAATRKTAGKGRDGTGHEAPGAAAATMASPVASAPEDGRDASVLHLVDVERMGARHASGHAGPPLSTEAMADRVRARLEGANPTTRVVDRLCKEIAEANGDTWTQRDARKVYDILAKKERTGS